MDVTPEQAQKLVADVQIAHRLVVGFYERLLPTFDSLSDNLGFDFWFWSPTETSRPCGENTRPTKNWLWDMVPLFAAEHAYRKVNGKRLKVGDMALSFNVYIDDNFNSDVREVLGHKGKPDPILLPLGKGTIAVDLYRATKRSNESFEQAWENANEPTPELSSWHSVHPNMQAVALRVLLADFISEPEATRNLLRTLISQPYPEPET